MTTDNRYLVAIDTDGYAGNFERETAAFVTGQVGECGVGGEVAATTPSEVKSLFEVNLEHRPDEHGCSRPCAIYPTPGVFNHGMGGEFPDDTDPVLVAEDYRERVEKYIQSYPGSKLDTEWNGARFPAYRSIAIFFLEKPSERQLEVLQVRAIEYLTQKGVTPLAIRVIVERTTTETISTHPTHKE